MKICFITTIHTTLQSFVLEFAEFIHQKTDWDITFICNHDERFALSLPAYIHYIPVKMERGISVSGIKAMLDMLGIFRSEEFDLVQYSTPNASCYASIAGWLAKVPVRLYCQWGLAFEGFTGIKRQLFKSIEKITCILSTWIEPDSFGNMNYCRSLNFYGEDKSSVILSGSACGVSIKKFDYAKRALYREEVRRKYSIPRDAYVFGFVGSITGDKGINELIAASRIILTTESKVYVTLVGEKEKEESLNQELLDWAESEERFIFCGHSDHVEKNMAAMDCYITASYREGFGMTVIEAGAMGLPVITTNIPGPTDVIIDGFNGLVVEKKNLNELTEAMRWICKNPSEASAMGMNGMENVLSRYDRRKLFDAMLEDRKRLLRDA